MKHRDKLYALDPEQPESVSGCVQALGVYRPGFRHKKESLQFFKACVGDELYSKAMGSEAGREHHYAVARAFLSQPDWEKFVWVEEYGSLDGFPRQ